MVRNNFYKLGIYAERQVPYLPKFIHKCLLAREQSQLAPSPRLSGCLCVLQLWNLHASHTQIHRLRERIEQPWPTNRHTNHKMDSAAADRVRLLQQHMVESRHSKATGCLLGVQLWASVCVWATWTWHLLCSHSAAAVATGQLASHKTQLKVNEKCWLSREQTRCKGLN